MTKQPVEDVPPNVRIIAAGLAAASAIGLLLNHWMAESQNTVRLMILCLGPMMLFLGIGGIVEPRIFWSLGKYGQHLPIKYKFMGGALGAAGVVVTIVLVFFVYPLGRPQ
ncbi:MAG: hypothetical protein IAF94_09105 [Pirellulaceae bacterium]|nr:hypothetical protein [Pirellulaceae bacterium]